MTRSRQTADWGSRAGLAKVIPSSVAVGSGTGSANSLGTVSFSGCSSVSLNGIFNSTYDFYKIIMSGVSSADVVLSLRFRISGSDNSTSNYTSTGTFTSQNAGPTRSAELNASAFTVATVGDSGFSNEISIFYPFSTTYRTFVQSSYFADFTSDREAAIKNGLFNGTTQFDSISFFPGSGTITGSLSIYGYTQ